MTEALTTVFARSIARCLAQTSGVDVERIVPLVKQVLDAPEQPLYAQIGALQEQIDLVLGEHDQIDLVLGGATKIKGYVFEAPKLPEIRGASTLLDWVNEVELPKLWDAHRSEQVNEVELRKLWNEHGIVYGGGGGFLAFAPHGQGQHRARRIEQTYTEWTLTANSTAAAASFRLIELRYGRDPLGYWLDDFLRDWAVPARREQLRRYYYSPADDTDEPPEPPAQRFFRRKTFGELVTLLTLETGRRRDERPFDQGPSFFPRQPWDERCDSSEQRPALGLLPINALDEDELRLDMDLSDRLSLASARKVIVGRMVKEISIRKAASLMQQIDWKGPDFKQHQEGWNQRWCRYLLDHPDTPYARSARDRQVRPSHDVEEIGAASKRSIALIYADGNNVGRLMATLSTPQDYARISGILSDVTRQAVFDGLAQFLKPQPANGTGEYLHPFEILTVGGDDLLLLVPGNLALDITLEIARSFEQLIVDKFTIFIKELQDAGRQLSLPPKTPLGKRSRYQRGDDASIEALRAAEPWLGLSAGVVVAREDAPIFFLRNLVEELLKSAKKKASAQAKGGYFGGAVDFMVLKSITMVTDKVADFRRAGLEHDAGHERRHLYARPYAWHELAGLLRTVRALREAGLPRSQLYRLGDTLEAALTGGLNASMLEYLFTRTRMRQRHSEALALHVEHAWYASGESGLRLPPWMQRALPKSKRDPTPVPLRETIWLDMLEIYDLVAVEKEPVDGQD